MNLNNVLEGIVEGWSKQNKLLDILKIEKTNNIKKKT